MNDRCLRCTTLFFSFQHRDVGRVPEVADCDLLRGRSGTRAMLTATRKVFSGYEDRNDPVNR